VHNGGLAAAVRVRRNADRNLKRWNVKSLTANFYKRIGHQRPTTMPELHNLALLAGTALV
jgi:hypothetical protein